MRKTNTKRLWMLFNNSKEINLKYSNKKVGFRINFAKVTKSRLRGLVLLVPIVIVIHIDRLTGFKKWS